MQKTGFSGWSKFEVWSFLWPELQNLRLSLPPVPTMSLIRTCNPPIQKKSALIPEPLLRFFFSSFCGPFESLSLMDPGQIQMAKHKNKKKTISQRQETTHLLLKLLFSRAKCSLYFFCTKQCDNDPQTLDNMHGMNDFVNGRALHARSDHWPFHCDCPESFLAQNGIVQTFFPAWPFICFFNGWKCPHPRIKKIIMPHPDLLNWTSKIHNTSIHWWQQTALSTWFFIVSQKWSKMRHLSFSTPAGTFFTCSKTAHV